ncbi:hypothetical protein YC2023_116773 [Brassica napus]
MLCLEDLPEIERKPVKKLKKTLKMVTKALGVLERTNRHKLAHDNSKYKPCSFDNWSLWCTVYQIQLKFRLTIWFVYVYLYKEEFSSLLDHPHRMPRQKLWSRDKTEEMLDLHADSGVT